MPLQVPVKSAPQLHLWDANEHTETHLEVATRSTQGTILEDVDRPFYALLSPFSTPSSVSFSSTW
jgi:hypothetical protein